MDVLCPLESDSFSLSLPLTFPLSLINSAGFKVTFVEECRCVWPSAFVQSSKRWFNTADSRSIDPLCIAQTVFHRAIWDSVAFFMKFLYGFLPCQGWVEKFSPDYCCTNEEIVFFFRPLALWLVHILGQMVLWFSCRLCRIESGLHFPILFLPSFSILFLHVSFTKMAKKCWFGS